MAMHYMLAAEVGQRLKAAEDFIQPFNDLVYKLTDDRRCRIQVGASDITKDREGNYCCCIAPDGAGLGVYSAPMQVHRVIENDKELTDLGVFLYDHLRRAPEFRY